MKYYYKAVRVKNDKFFSLIKGLGYLELEYKIGKETIPKVGKIFLFDTLENAKDNIDYNKPGEKILKVKAKNVDNLYYCAFIDIKSIKMFWDNFENGTPMPNLVDESLLGTLVADSVTPIEVVKIG